MIFPALTTVLGLMFFSAWIYAISEGSWMKVMAFSSLSIKGALFILLWGNLTGNTSITVAALAILILGDLGVMVLAIFLERRIS